MRVGFIGLGEAGSISATAVAAAGHHVNGFDPAPTPSPDGVERLDSVEAVVAASDLTIVLTGAALSRSIAETAAGAIRPGTVYADFTTASPEEMVTAEEGIVAAGGRFADVAILGPVPLKGAATETIVSGAPQTSSGSCSPRWGPRSSTSTALPVPRPPGSCSGASS
jgi:3-hydroxyisobutyrate dehydrogenase